MSHFDRCLMCAENILNNKDAVSVFKELPYTHVNIVSMLTSLMGPFVPATVSHIVCKNCAKLLTTVDDNEKRLNKAKSQVLTTLTKGVEKYKSLGTELLTVSENRTVSDRIQKCDNKQSSSGIRTSPISDCLSNGGIQDSEDMICDDLNFPKMENLTLLETTSQIKSNNTTASSSGLCTHSGFLNKTENQVSPEKKGAKTNKNSNKKAKVILCTSFCVNKDLNGPSLANNFLFFNFLPKV